MSELGVAGLWGRCAVFDWRLLDPDKTTGSGNRKPETGDAGLDGFHVEQPERPARGRARAHLIAHAQPRAAVRNGQPVARTMSCEARVGTGHIGGKADPLVGGNQIG